jgi:RNA polymerase sigma-70 factor (sigma-E family)
VGPADEEFDAYVRFRTPALLRSAYLLTGDQHLAEDLVQTALVRTHRVWSRIHQGNPDAYVRKVMYHQQIAWWRRRRLTEAPLENVPELAGWGGPDEAAAISIRVSLRGALLKLTPRQRAVLVLRYFEDRTEVETAELLGVAVGTVKSQTAKALARMREIAPELVELSGVGQSPLRGGAR